MHVRGCQSSSRYDTDYNRLLRLKVHSLYRHDRSNTRHVSSRRLVAIDGSKFKAVNSKGNNYTPKKLQFHIERVERHIDNYLQQLDDSDKEAEKHVDGTPIQEKITWLKQRLAELKTLEVEVNQHPDKQLSTTDPDSRLLKTQGMTRAVCYNVQSAVDTKHHLIVAHEVTNKQDRGLLT